MKAIPPFRASAQTELMLFQLFNLIAGAETNPVFRVGITDFSPIAGNERFFSVYKLTDTANNTIYTDKFGMMMIMDLTRIDLAEDEDRKYKRYVRARMFKAKTWEEFYIYFYKP